MNITYCIRLTSILSTLFFLAYNSVAQPVIEKRETQPDGLQIVSYSWQLKKTTGSSSTITRYGLFDPKSNSFLLNMLYHQVRNAKQPGKYLIQDTTFSHNFSLYDATQKKMLTSFEYSFMHEFTSGVSVVSFFDSTQKKTRYTLLDPNGKRAAFAYDVITLAYSGVMTFKQDGKWGLMKTDGTIIRPAEFYIIEKIRDGLASFRREEKSLVGYLDINGVEVIPPSFEQADDFMQGRAVVYTKRASWRYTQGSGSNDQVGVINTRGEFVIPPSFNSIDNPPGTRSIFIVTNADKKRGVYDRNGKLLQDFNITYVGSWSQGRTVVSLAGWGASGLMDTLGRWIIPATYNIIDTKQGTYISGSKGAAYDIFDSTGTKLFRIDSSLKVILGKGHILTFPDSKTVVVLDYKGKKLKSIEQIGMSTFSTNFTKGGDSVFVAYNQLTTIHNFKTKKQLYTTEPTELGGFQEERLLAKNYNGFFWMDLQGKRISTKNYAQASSFVNGIAFARVGQYDSKVKLINLSGNEMGEVNGTPLTSFEDGLIWVKSSNKNTILAVDSLGKTLWSVDSATGAKHLGNKMVAIQNMRSKYMLYSVQGKRLSDSLFDELGLARDGVIGFKKNNRFGFMDYQANIVIAPTYKGATNSSGKLIVLQSGNEVYVVNPAGKRLTDSTFTSGRDPIDGIAPVARAGKWGLINAQGKLIVPCLYEDVMWAAANRIFIKKGTLWSLADYNGKPIGNLAFSNAEPFREGYARVVSNNSMGLIDMQGNWVLKPLYKDLFEVKNQMTATYQPFGSRTVPIKN